MHRGGESPQVRGELLNFSLATTRKRRQGKMKTIKKLLWEWRIYRIARRANKQLDILITVNEIEKKLELAKKLWG
jgi:hypothetical protein